MTPWAFIPARGGSKRLPRKALADLGGKPLIAWTIEAALAADCFREVCVSSDDAEIRDVAAAYGATVHRRVPELATDRVTLAQVLKSVRRDRPDPIAVLLPTSPFRTPETIRQAVGMFGRRDGEQLLSVAPYPHPPQWALIRHGLTVMPAYPALWEQPRGALTPAWLHDGSYWMLGGPGQGIYAFETPAAEVCDINTPEDLAWAQWTLAQRQAVAI